jgi:hypothetical protein
MGKVTEVTLRHHTRVRDIIHDVREFFHIPHHAKCKLFDAKGYEIYDDDIDFFQNGEPIFLSKGEPYDRRSALAMYDEIRVLG